MLGYYKRTIIKLLSHVQELRTHPWNDPQKCLAVQETLIQKIIYAEKKIQDLKRNIRENKKRLGTKQTVKLTKEEANRIKAMVASHQKTIEDYRHLLDIWRRIGDALAFIYLPKSEIKPMTLKESSGFISGKKGFRLERRILRFVFKKGTIALLNDLTSCLRYGDITILKVDKPPMFMEVKSSHRKNKRLERQQTALESLTEYLRTDKTERDGHEVTRIASHTTERDYLEELNRLVNLVKREEYCFKEIENGLYYYIETQYNRSRLEEIIQKLDNPAIVYYLNMFEFNPSGYYPFTLSIHDPEAVLEFYQGQLLIFVLIDPEVIKRKLSINGLAITFDYNKDWIISIAHADPKKANDFGPVRIGRYFFGRIACEFLSLDWFLEEIIYKFNHPAIQEWISSPN